MTGAQLKKTLDDLSKRVNGGHDPDLQYFLDTVFKNDPGTLKARADAFHRMIGGTISVLPPDARHVDYDVIPVNISDGCLYNCRFCSVKTGKGFRLRDKEDIETQIRHLQAFYGSDIRNFNSIFLGQHDALHAGLDVIAFAAEAATI